MSININERYKVGFWILRSYYHKLRNPPRRTKPLLSLGKFEKTIIKNLYSNEVRETKLNDHVIKYMNPLGFLHSYKELIEENIYYFESEEKSPVIVDCGSNLGLSIIYFKTLFPDSKVLGFEPDPKLFELLQANVQSFSNVEVRNEAVWKQNEFLTFQTDPSLAGHISNDKDDEKSSTVVVKAIRLKDVIEKYNVIDFLKIDIEFAELDVVEDIADILPRVKNLFIEFHSIGGNYLHELTRLLSVLEDKGFRYYIKEAYNFLESPFTREAKKNMKDTWNSFNIFAINMK